MQSFILIGLIVHTVKPPTHLLSLSRLGGERKEQLATTLQDLLRYIKAVKYKSNVLID